jgi:hypothetical protein
MNCVTTPTTFNRCDPKISSDCVIWGYPPIPCLGICTNDSLTEMQYKFAENLCKVIGLTDLSSVTIPDCLVQAWGTQDKTILNLINILLENTCDNTNSINTINSTIQNLDPLVTVDYKCCSTNPCVTTGTVRLSVALENIISCICTQNSVIQQLQSDIASYQTQINSLNSLYTNLQSSLVSLTNSFNSFALLVAGSSNPASTGGLVGRINCIITTLNNNSISTNCP